MTTWTRAEWDHMCGGCGQQIRPGHLMQVTQLIGVSKPIRRCVLCADGAPPADMPRFVAPAPKVSPATESRRRKTAQSAPGLPPDYKAKASGE